MKLCKVLTMNLNANKSYSKNLGDRGNSRRTILLFEMRCMVQIGYTANNHPPWQFCKQDNVFAVPKLTGR